jgi:hypothetical protein
MHKHAKNQFSHFIPICAVSTKALGYNNWGLISEQWKYHITAQIPVLSSAECDFPFETIICLPYNNTAGLTFESLSYFSFSANEKNEMKKYSRTYLLTDRSMITD